MTSIRFQEVGPSDLDLLVAWTPSQSFPFHVKRRVDEAWVRSQAETGYFWGPEVKCFWAFEEVSGPVAPGTRPTVGDVLGLFRIFDLDDETPLLDLRVSDEARGRGVGVAAVQWVAGHAFETTPKLNRVGGYTRHDNLAMQRVFEKCGFQREAHHRQCWPVEGSDIRMDAIGYAVLRSEWPAVVRPTGGARSSDSGPSRDSNGVASDLARPSSVPSALKVFGPEVARPVRGIDERMNAPWMLRPFRESDTGAVVELWRLCDLVRPWNDPHKDIARKLRVQRELFLVLLENEVPLGTVMAGYEGHRGWVNYLAVRPDRQGRGWGRLLMDEAERRLRALGCPKINLQVRTTNDPVLAFYRAIGYRQDEVQSFGKRLEVDGPGPDAPGT